MAAPGTKTRLVAVLLSAVMAMSSIEACLGWRGKEPRSPLPGTQKTLLHDNDNDNDNDNTRTRTRTRRSVLLVPRGGDDNVAITAKEPSAKDDNDNDNDNDNPDNNDSGGSFEILGEETVYHGWRTVLRRTVRMRNGRVVDFDLVGQTTGEAAVLVFAWDTRTKTATLIKEYMPASHRVLWGLAAGLVEDKKHGRDTEVAARHELEEECHLTGGREWIPLLTKPAAMDKYATTTIQCYLVIDPEHEEDPKPLDDEEDIEIVAGVTIPEILEHIQNGEMNLVGAYGSLL
eukprot:CAMPEP_0172392224 /NCGR_PEP_ID=MMETSP1061-20121228/8419_1 /TAXON_ID=37318 /ORGANISM="Pseudo-nitzschia pungens, Strain cf. pungens" /LENGTH=287 /DNA_ID=CAMNT_0013123021 /DNA_START=81 /DNA_END=940 /DNA_ORIENTATION=+